MKPMGRVKRVSQNEESGLAQRVWVSLGRLISRSENSDVIRAVLWFCRWAKYAALNPKP